MASHFTIRHLRPYATREVAYVVFVVLSVVFTMATALSVADFLKILFEPDTDAGAVAVASGNLISQWLEGLYSWLIAFGQSRAILYFSLIVFVLYALKNIFSYLSAVTISVIRTRVVCDIRNSLFATAMRLPVGYYVAHRKGDILARFSNDVVEYEEGVLGSLQMLATAVISIVLYMFMLFYINVKLTLFVLCMLPIVVFVISGISRKLKRKSKVLQEKNAYLMSLTEETIMGLKVIKSYTAIDFSNRRFRSYNKAYAKERTAMFRRINLASPVSDFMGNAIVIGILLFGAWLVFNGDHGLTPELFISYIMLFVLMIPPAKELTTAISQIKKGQACADRLQEFLSEAIEGEDDAVGTFPEGQPITFQHVGFAYPSGAEVLHNICLSIPAGHTVALVGSSGSGKSTLADLLSRYYEPTSGVIMIGDTPLNNFSLATVRRSIGRVDQDCVLFNDSVLANIAFGTPSATLEEVVQAAKVANAHSFIEQLPQGYHTNIGDGGSLLSGGQRQRICIARAVLRNPQLLIFDEATSALDTESERQVQQALDNVLQHRSAIIIAHRLSTIVNADEIVVIEGGSIVERGTHSQLMAQDGRYRQLCQLQKMEGV